MMGSFLPQFQVTWFWKYCWYTWELPLYLTFCFLLIQNWLLLIFSLPFPLSNLSLTPTLHSRDKQSWSHRCRPVFFLWDNTQHCYNNTHLFNCDHNHSFELGLHLNIPDHQLCCPMLHQPTVIYEHLIGQINYAFIPWTWILTSSARSSVYSSLNWKKLTKEWSEQLGFLGTASSFIGVYKDCRSNTAKLKLLRQFLIPYSTLW